MNNFPIWMRWTGLLCAGIVCAAIAATGTAQAAVDSSQTQTVSATFASSASLTLGANTVPFGTITGSGAITSPAAINVTVDARTDNASTITLTVTADHDLTDSTSDSIPIANLTWASTGSGFTASGTTDTIAGTPAGVSVGSWGASGSHTGAMTFSLANSLSYPSGAYSATLTYTLTAP